MIRRYKIMHALAAERLGFYERLEVDKYKLSGLIVDYLNNFPSPSAEIKQMMDRFKVWGLDMMHPMWINMMLTARSNCAF